MLIEVMTLVFSIVAIFLAGIAAIFSFMAYSTCVGIEKSTHQVQMVPLEGLGGSTGDDLIEDMGKAFGMDTEQYDDAFEKYDPNDVEQ